MATPADPPGKGCAIGCSALMIIALIVYAWGELGGEKADAPIASTWSGPPIVDIRSIAGRSRQEVEEAMGSPDSMATEMIHGRSQPVGYYRDGSVEVVFVNGEGEWVTIWGRGEIPYSSDALPALGLDARQPELEAPAGGLRWKNIPGILELNVFPSDSAPGTASYAFIEVKRPI